MAGRLFKRIAKLTIAVPVVVNGIDDLFKIAPNAIEIEDLAFEFQITKTLPSEPNTATIKVFNLSQASRALLEKKPLKVFLDVGYDGDAGQIWRGDVTWSQSERTTDGWTTTIQSGDGSRAFRHARINKSFSGGVDAKKLMSEIASSMGLRVPTSVTDARDLVKQFVNGTTLSGVSHKELTRIARASGYGWSIQNGQLQMLKQGSATTAEAVPVSQDTGMIGSPSFAAPQEAKKAPVLSVKTLLNREVQAGRLIAVSSLQINGNFRVNKVQHNGATHGNAWETSMEAVQL